MTPPIVLVGPPDDAHIAAVKRRLEDLGAAHRILDGSRFPDELPISLGHRLDDITIDAEPLPRPAAVYIRDLHSSVLSPWVNADAEMQQNWRRTMVAFREKAHVMFSVIARWAEAGVPTYNPPSPEWRLSKPFQLALLGSAGLPVPTTRWTNDPTDVRGFVSDRRAIYKPVAGGAATKELSPDDLTDERLAKLSGAPVTFQELLPGDNFRVYVLNGRIVASLRIASESIDFRQNEEKIDIVELPDEVRQICLRACEVLGLRWTGMDLKEAPDGSLKILELNSSPMFLGFDNRAGTDVLGALAGALIGHQSAHG